MPQNGRRTPSDKGGHRRSGRNTERDFHGEKRSNDTHCSTTDPDARLFRKAAGQKAKLCCMGHLMTENRNALIVDARLTRASGRAERATALDMIEDNVRPGGTVGGDKRHRHRRFVGDAQRSCAHITWMTPTVVRQSMLARHATLATGSSTIKQTSAKKTVWLDEDGWWLAQDPPSWPRSGKWFFVLTATAYNLIPNPKDSGSSRMGMTSVSQ